MINTVFPPNYPLIVLPSESVVKAELEIDGPRVEVLVHSILILFIHQQLPHLTPAISPADSFPLAIQYWSRERGKSQVCMQ